VESLTSKPGIREQHRPIADRPDRNPATQRAPAVSCYPSVRPRHRPNLTQNIRMAHYRKPLAAAAALNTAIFVVEAIAGFQADSLSLLMDSVHNLSDEMALVFLYLAFILPRGVSRHLLRSANVFNSVGLVLVSGLLLWQAVERMLHPAPVVGSVAIIVGLLAAAANWGVARLLLAPSRNNAAIRLAYIHNMGDVYVSLAPVGAGLLVSVIGYSIFDPLIAAGIAIWIMPPQCARFLGRARSLSGRRKSSAAIPTTTRRSPPPPLGHRILVGDPRRWCR
jgi:Co/Zn/Cd efflux system component